MTVHYLTIEDYYADWIPNLADRIWQAAHIEYAMPDVCMDLVRDLCTAGRQMDQVMGGIY